MPVLAAGNTVYTRPVAKVMISIPDLLLERVDAYVDSVGETRSGFLQRLAERELAADARAPQARSSRSCSARPWTSAAMRPRS